MSEPTSPDPSDPSPTEIPASIALPPGPLDVRSAALSVIAALLVFHTLVFASDFLIPIHLAVLANLALSPVIRTLQSLRLPAPLGAGLVLAVVGLTLLLLANLLVEPAQDWLKRSPESLAQIEHKLRFATRPLEEVTRATNSVEDMVDLGSAGASKVLVKSPGLLGSLLSGTQNFFSSGAIVIVLLYFLLAGGDSFLRKLVTVLPTLSDKIRAVEIARRTEQAISRYLLTICLINFGLAAAVATAMWAASMPNPLLWGALAGGLNFVPFLGPAISTTLVGAAAVLTFDSFDRFLIPPLACASITALEGLLITPALLGRHLTLSPVVIFLAVMALSWAWGILGALMAVPTLVMIKIVCDEVGTLQALGIMMEAEVRT